VLPVCNSANICTAVSYGRVEEFSSLRLRSSIFCCGAHAYTAKFFRHFTLTHVYWGRTRFRKSRITSSFLALGSSSFQSIVDLFDLIRHIRSGDHSDFRFCRQGAPKNFSSNSIFSATACPISEIFSGSCAPRRALFKLRGSWGSGVIFGGQAPQVKIARNGPKGRESDCNSKNACKKSSWSNLKWICKSGSSCVLRPIFVQIESRGRRVKKLGRRHISTSGLASSAPETLFFTLLCSELSPYRTQTARNAFCKNTGCTKSKSWPGSTIQKPEILPKMHEMVRNAVKFIFIRKSRRRQTGSSIVLWPTFGQIGIRGH